MHDSLKNGDIDLVELYFETEGALFSQAKKKRKKKETVTETKQNKQSLTFSSLKMTEEIKNQSQPL